MESEYSKRKLMPEVRARIEQARFFSRVNGKRVPISLSEPVVMDGISMGQPDREVQTEVLDPVINAVLKDKALLNDLAYREDVIERTMSAYQSVLEKGFIGENIDTEPLLTTLRARITSDDNALLEYAEIYTNVSEELSRKDIAPALNSSQELVGDVILTADTPIKLGGD